MKDHMDHIAKKRRSEKVVIHHDTEHHVPVFTKKDREDQSKGMKRYEDKMKKDRADERKGMEKHEAKMRKDRRDESRGMKSYEEDKRKKKR